MLTLTRKKNAPVYLSGPAAVQADRACKLTFVLPRTTDVYRSELFCADMSYARAVERDARQRRALSLLASIERRTDLPPDIARAVRDVLTGWES